MREIVTTMTQRGQVTVPAEVRRLLGLKPRDKVAFEIVDGEVRISRPRFTLETVFGSVKPLKRTDSIEEIIRQSREERAERAIRKMERE